MSQLVTDIGRDELRGEGAYRALCAALQSGRYRPGDRLREAEIAAELGISRTPVREALGRLVARGLAAAAGGRGLVVATLDRSQILELYAMREILEGAAARMAAQRAAEPELEALQAMLDAFVAARTDPLRMAAVNRDFHAAIVEAAGNRYLQQALGELQDAIALLRVTTFTAPKRPETARREHAVIVEAIARRDPEAAEQAARLHIREALRTRLSLPT